MNVSMNLFLFNKIHSSQSIGPLQMQIYAS
uniref:Uncharacterized protein n=1 Tax=Anguilla anguilla TaxID=7936 RepID=A0A0E9REB0_ANGAN